MVVRKRAITTIVFLMLVLNSHFSVAEQMDFPVWTTLSEDQRKVLAPLADEWDSLRPWQRERMLEIAHDYPKMSAERQERVQKRLTKWSRMTPFERENVRKRYQQFQAMPAEKKKKCVKNGVNIAIRRQKSVNYYENSTLKFTVLKN